MSNDPTRITRLQAIHFGGLKEVDVQLTKQTLVTGATGTGKTSVLDILRAAFTGKGHQAQLVQLGEEKAVLLVELNDGTAVKRTLKDGHKTASLAVTKDGMHPAKPQDFLNALFGLHAFNVVDFFKNSVAEQTVELLALTDVAVSPEDYAELSGGELIEGIDYSRHPLEVLVDVQDVLFSERTGINRELKEKQGAAAEGLRGLPEDFDADAIRETDLSSLVDRQAAMRQHNEQVAANQRTLEGIDEQVSALEQQIADLGEEKRLQDKWLVDNPCRDTAVVDEQIRDFQQQQEILHSYDVAQTSHQKATELDKESERLTGLIKAIRAKPAQLLSELDEVPIEGMGLDEDHNITINGKPLGVLSTGEQIDLAFDIAERYAGDVPILLLDGLEALDSEMQAKVQEKLHKSDCQCVVTKVTDGELEIKEW